MDARAERARKRYGRRAELIATWLLRLRGVRVLERNLRVPGGCEIDVVGRSGSTLVLCEVKARRAGDAGAAVSDSRRRALARSAEILLAEGAYGWAREARFDVVAVDGLRPRHLPSAFAGAP